MSSSPRRRNHKTSTRSLNDWLGDAPAAPDTAPVRDQVEEIARRFAALSLLKADLDKQREDLQTQAAALLADQPLAHPIERIDSDGVYIRISRQYDAELVEQVLRERLAEGSGLLPDQIDTILKSPNFQTQASYDASRLIDLVRQHLKIDIRSDARFASACLEPSQPKADLWVQYLLTALDPDGEIDYDSLLSSRLVRLELAREAASSPVNQVRVRLLEDTRAQMDQLITNLRHRYEEERSRVLAEKAAATPSPRRASSRSKSATGASGSASSKPRAR